MINMITTVLYVGKLRPAPGTWGSAVALAAGVGLHFAGGFPLLALATVAVSLLGFWAVPRDLASRADGDHDPSEIVIDEVAGQWLTLCFPSLAFWAMGFDSFPYPAYLGAFVAFRFFDIKKPWAVGRADRRGDAVGVMLDDIYAGLYAGVAVLILGALAHIPIILAS